MYTLYAFLKGASNSGVDGILTTTTKRPEMNTTKQGKDKEEKWKRKTY